MRVSEAVSRSLYVHENKFADLDVDIDLYAIRSSDEIDLQEVVERLEVAVGAEVQRIQDEIDEETGEA